MAWFDAVVSPLKTAGETLQKLIELRDLAKFGKPLGELYAQVISAQQGAVAAQTEQFALLERVRQLEKQIADMDTWNCEKQKYELKEVYSGAFAYALKDRGEGTEPPHWICAACYQKGQKRIIQKGAADLGLWLYVCPSCKAAIRANWEGPSGKIAT